ncbi:MAG: hypothetical protein RLZZ303_1268, partial [Candidatus Hydrogenedentota bacterium]
KDDTFYDFDFAFGQGTAQRPEDEQLTSAPDPGNGYFLAMRTTSAWARGDSFSVRVYSAQTRFLQFFDPITFQPFNPPRIGTPAPGDNFNPNFADGPLDTGTYTSSFGVVDIRSPREPETRFNNWNWPNYQYTPRAEFNRFRFNAVGLTLESYLGELMDVRDLISIENWTALLGIDLHGTATGQFLQAQPTELNIVLTDVGADPFGPPGNGGFDPRNGRIEDFTSNVTTIGEDRTLAIGDDHTFNGIGLFSDQNNNGIFDRPEPRAEGVGVTIQGDFPMYVLTSTFNDFVVPGLLEWEYVPFPPGGGDPWWKAKIRFLGGARPGDFALDNTAGTMEGAPDEFEPGVPRPDYFVVMRADSGFRDIGGLPADGTAMTFGAEMRPFIEPRRWNPQDGGHWDGGLWLGNSWAGREFAQVGNRFAILQPLEFWQDDPRLDYVCEEGVYPCPALDQSNRTYAWWTDRTQNQTTVKPIKTGIDVHDLVLTYSTNNKYAKASLISERQGRDAFVFFQDPPNIITSSIDYGNGSFQDAFGILELNFFQWDSASIVPDIIFGVDDVFLPEHYAYETVPFRMDEFALDPQLREPRSVFFPTPAEQPTLPDADTWPPAREAVAFGESSYVYLESEGDVANEPYLPASTVGSEATYADDVYVFVAEDCNNCSPVQPGMWLVDRYGARFPIASVSGNRFTLERGHNAYMDRNLRFSAGLVNLPDYPFGVPVGEQFAVRRGRWMVVEDAIERTQYTRQQDWPAGLASQGGTRAARILKQKVEVNSQPTAMLGINLAAVDDPVVNASNTISLNSVTVAFWGPEFTSNDLNRLDPDGALNLSGVLLYEDTNTNGAFDGPILDPFSGTTLVSGGDNIVPLEPGSLGWQGTGPEPIDLDGDFIADDLSGDGVIVLNEAEQEANADNPDYDGFLDLAWVLRLEPAAKWTVPFRDPGTSDISIPSFKASTFNTWPSFWTQQPTFLDLADAPAEDKLAKALNPDGENDGDDLFVVVRTSNTISAFEQFRALIPSKLPNRAPASEQVAGIELSPITYPVIDSFRKTDPEEGAVQSFYGHDMLETSVPSRIVDLSTGLIPSSGTAIPVIEPGSAPAAVLGLDLSVNRSANEIGAGTNGSQISNGFTTASFTKAPPEEFFSGGWTDAVIGFYLIATSEAGTSGFESRVEAFEITGVNGNDLTLRAGRPRIGSPWLVVKDPTFLEQVVVEFFDVGLDGEFDPQRDLLPLNLEDPANGLQSGVSVYRDNDFSTKNRNGVFDPPVLDADGQVIEYIDLPVRLDHVPAFVGVPGEPEYQVRMVFSTPGTDDLQGRTSIAYETQARNRQWVPQTFGLGSADPNTGSDFFVVLRTARDMSEGDDFRVGIASWGPNTPSLPDPDNFNPSLSPSELPGQLPDEFDIFDEFPWGNRGLGFITFFRDPPPVYYWGYDHRNKRDIAVQEVDTSQDDKDIRYWVRSHPAVSGASFPITALPAPEIDFTADRNRQVPGGTVNFTLISSGTVSSILWNFGDGNTSTTRNPSHVYQEAGIYTVSASVTNSFGVSDTVTKVDYIEVTRAPFADFTASPLDGNITPDPAGVLPPGLNVSFVDRSQGTNDLVPIRYFWDFGDGQTTTTTTRATDEAPLVHRYLQPGFYTVSLEVTFQNPVTQATQVSVCELEALITVRECIGCPGSGEGEGEGEGGDGEAPAANLEITNLIRDKEALVPLHDWMPLVNIRMSYGEEPEDFAPRILRTLGFTLRPDTREPETFAIANINGPQVTDILEFGIFQETFDDDEENNGVLDNDNDFLLYTFDNTGAPVGTVNAGFSSTTYLLDFVANGTATNPRFRIEAGPEVEEGLQGNSYILAVRTSATWRSQTTMGITVFNAQMIDPRTDRFPVNEDAEPVDDYSPNFFEDEDLDEELAYSASFSVWDSTGNQFDSVELGGSELFSGSPFNFWNQNVFLYTPLDDHTRPLWNSIDRLFELTAGEVLEMRQLISSEQWVPVLAMNLHSASPVHTEFFDGNLNARDTIIEDHAQLKEVNLIFTDIGGDPLGSPGNGGFNPREHLDNITNQNWEIYEPTYAQDQTFNGAWVWSDTNGNGRFDPAEPDPTFNGVNFPGDRPLYANDVLSSWEYIPFPPGGGDPWWKITLRFFGGEQRPDSEDNFAGYLEAVPDNIFGSERPGASEVTFDYFVTVRADSGFQDVSLAQGDGNGIPAGADFRVFVEPRRFDAATGSQTGGIYLDSMAPIEGIVTNGVSIYSTWQDDPRWLQEEPWWPERTHNAKSVKPVRYGLEVHDLALTYQSDSIYRKETDLFVGGFPAWGGGCLTYAIPSTDRTDFDAWNDPFQLQQAKFLNQHSVGVTRWRFFGAQLLDFGAPIGTVSFSYDETGSRGQFAYETVPFFSNSTSNGDVPPVGPRSTAYALPPNQPALPDYSTWPAFQRPNEYQRASDWEAEDNQARLLTQQVEGNTAHTALLGINVTGADDPVVNQGEGPTIGKITVAFWGPDFSPEDLYPLEANGSTPLSGVLLWEDNDRNGVFADTEIFRQYAEGLPTTVQLDSVVPLQGLRWRSSPELVDLNGDGEPNDMNGDGVIDDLDRAWVLDLTPSNLWPVPRTDGPAGGFGTIFSIGFCGSSDFSKSGVTPPLKAELSFEASDTSRDKLLDTLVPQPGDDLFITIRTTNQVKRFEQIRAVIPATLPQRDEGQRLGGIQFFPQFNSSATAFVKSNPDEDPVQDFYGHDTISMGLPTRVIDLTDQNSSLVVGGPAVAPFGLDLSTNNGRGAGTVDSGTSGVPSDGAFQVSGEAWSDNAFAKDFLIDANYEPFEIVSNSSDTLVLRSGTPAEGRWRIVRNPSFLETVTVELYNEGTDADFNITTDLLPLNLDQELSGVALYRDNDNDPRNRNGIFDVNIDIPLKLDVVPRLVGQAGEATQVQFVFSTPGTDNVPLPLEQQTRHRQWIYDAFGDNAADVEFGPDFFVVIRASERMNPGDNFRMGVVGYGPITPTEPDPDTFARITGQAQNDFSKFREFPWAKRALGYITYFKEPQIRYFMDGDRAGQKVDNSGYDWMRSHSNRKKRTGVLTASNRTVSPRSVVIEGASETRLPSQTLPDQPFSLIINGRGFGTSPVVVISGYDVEVVSATDTQASISITVPEGTAPTEPIVVIVRNPTTGEEASRSDLFTLTSGVGQQRPDITSVSPANGGSEDFPATIFGVNFPSIDNALVLFGDTRMPVLNVAPDGTSITVGFPAGGLPATGPLNVTVRDESTGQQDVLLNGFNYTSDVGRSKTSLFSCAPQTAAGTGLAGDLVIVLGVAGLLMLSALRRRSRQ